MTLLEAPPAPGPTGASAARLRDRPWLLAACVALPVLEVTALWLLGLAGDRALALQVTAPSPWGEFHDIRWALVFNNTWLALALEALGIWAGRTLLNAFIVHHAWPSGVKRPPFWRQLRRTAVFTAAALVVLFPWAVLAFGVSVVSISWLFFAAVPPVVLLGLVIHHGPVTGQWWRRVPPLRGVGWVLLTFLFESVAGLAIGVAPAPLWLPVAAAAGLFNAWAWRSVVGAVLAHEPRRRFVPLAPAVIVGIVAAAVIGTTVSFALKSSRGAGSTVPAASEPAAGAGAPVLLVAGFDTTSVGAAPHPIPGPYYEVRYSYRGLSPDGRPLPYRPVDTHQSIRKMVRLLAAQVELLHQRTGRRVSIVAESEGSLLARVYMAADPKAPVDRLILLSPLDQPGRVFYPSAGHQGYGVFTGLALEGLTDVLGGISPVNLPADSPFLRSIVDHSRSLRGLLACPVDVPETMLEPLADAVADGKPPASGIPTIVVPAFHGGLLTDHESQLEVSALLAGKPVRSNPALADTERVIRLAAAAWQVPSLPLPLYTTDTSDSPSCSTMTAQVRSWIGLSGHG